MPHNIRTQPDRGIDYDPACFLALATKAVRRRRGGEMLNVDLLSGVSLVGRFVQFRKKTLSFRPASFSLVGLATL